MMIEKACCGKKQTKINRTRPAVLWLNREENNKIFNGKQIILILSQVNELRVAG